MNRLRELREELNLRQIDVSKATGIDQKTLSNYETEKTNPDSYSLIKLANFYKTSIDYIVGRTDTMLSDKANVIKMIEDMQTDLENIKKFLK
jgi:transcriptional regulator with XRE-family HTH domain